MGQPPGVRGTNLQGQNRARGTREACILGRRDRPFRASGSPEIACQKTRNPTASARIVECLGRCFRSSEILQKVIEFAQRKQRAAQLEADVDLLLKSLLALSEIREGNQCLFEPSHGFSKSRSLGRLCASLP